MQWSRVKSILLVILIIVDAFLIMTLAGGYVAERRSAEEKTEHFVSILSEKGVLTGEEFYLPEMMSLPMLEVDRNKNDEDSFTKGLLGSQVERYENSEGRTIYSSPSGNINWTADGKIFGHFVPDSYIMPSTERDIRLLTAKLLEHCGISSAVEIEVNVEERNAFATFDTAGAPVFNRFLQMTFVDEQIKINGWWTFQTPYMVRTNNYVSCEASDAILALLSIESSIQSIDKAELGYVMLNSTGRRLSIVPCCRIVTEQGEFFVDSLKNIAIYQ